MFRFCRPGARCGSVAGRFPLSACCGEASARSGLYRFLAHGFEILAEEYHLIGQLRAPHLLQNKADGTPWLWFEMEDASGTRYSTRNYRGETRINLYRRGPYYCEIHWFDVHRLRIRRIRLRCAATTLYCYPEKILADITWHGSGRFVPASMEVKGLVEQKYDGFKPFAKGTIELLVPDIRRVGTVAGRCFPPVGGT